MQPSSTIVSRYVSNLDAQSEEKSREVGLGCAGFGRTHNLWYLAFHSQPLRRRFTYSSACSSAQRSRPVPWRARRASKLCCLPCRDLVRFSCHLSRASSETMGHMMKATRFIEGVFWG